MLWNELPAEIGRGDQQRAEEQHYTLFADDVREDREHRREDHAHERQNRDDVLGSRVVHVDHIHDEVSPEVREHVVRGTDEAQQHRHHLRQSAQFPKVSNLKNIVHIAFSFFIQSVQSQLRFMFPFHQEVRNRREEAHRGHARIDEQVDLHAPILDINRRLEVRSHEHEQRTQKPRNPGGNAQKAAGEPFLGDGVLCDTEGLDNGAGDGSADDDEQEVFGADSDEAEGNAEENEAVEDD